MQWLGEMRPALPWEHSAPWRAARLHDEDSGASLCERVGGGNAYRPRADDENVWSQLFGVARQALRLEHYALQSAD